jgi:WD40 repeat protein
MSRATSDQAGMLLLRKKTVCLLLFVVLQHCLNFASCAINDVSWHSGGSCFAAATEQGQLLLQDIRAQSPAAGAAAAAGSASSTSHLRQLTTAGMKAAGVHVSRNRDGQQSNPQADCLTVDFDPNHPHRLATGGADGYVYVLDMRRLERPLEKLSLHAGDVRQVSWSRGAAGLLASAGNTTITSRQKDAEEVRCRHVQPL